ncbi:MAG TPA: acyl-CoA carboxylase epsilon subunit [Actinocatenispora sp.]
MDSPVLTVVGGEPMADELAALVAVLAARAVPAAAPPAPRPLWRDPAARLGVTRRGPLAWRTGARPQ